MSDLLQAKIRPVPKALTDTIHNNQSFLLVAHHKPDGDAIGSLIAMGKGLKSMGKTVDYYVDMPFDVKLTFFEEIKFFNRDLKSFYDVLLFLDCGDRNFSVLPEKDIQFHQTMVIDHHCSNVGFCDVNFVETASSAAEVVFRVLESLDVSFDEEMVDAIYTGISTDSGQFEYSDLSPETFRIVGELYRYKKDFSLLAKRLHHLKSFEQTKLYGIAAASAKLYESGQIACVVLSGETIAAYGGMVNVPEDVANIGVNIAGVALAVTFKETDDDTYRVSLRSNEPWPIDVSGLAKAYGGGGHYRAAGLTFKGKMNDFLSEAIAYFHDCIG